MLSGGEGGGSSSGVWCNNPLLGLGNLLFRFQEI